MKQYQNPTVEMICEELADILTASSLTVNEGLGEIYGLDWNDLK